MTVRALAAMAVVRQAASVLQHEGLTCAQLYLSQALQELPGIRSAAPSARALAAAAARASAKGGGVEDCPKHAALARVLKSAVTMTPVC